MRHFMVTYSESIVATSVRDYFQQSHNTQNFLSSLEECYKNSSGLFQRIIAVNDTVFIMADFEYENQIIGYLFYTDRENIEITVNEKLTRCIYNGYAFIKESYRKTGALKNLLLFATDFYKEKYSGGYLQLLFYAVTSNPFALRGYYNVFETARPSQDGLLTQDDLLIAEFLKKRLFIHTDQNQHPFTFKTDLPQRYRENFRKTFNRKDLEEVDFLNQLNIDESNGDRFLFYWTTLI